MTREHSVQPELTSDQSALVYSEKTKEETVIHIES